MNAWTVIAIVTAAWTAATVFLRAEMLRKRLDPRKDQPWPTYQGNWSVIIAMDVAALGFVGVVLELVRHPDWCGLGLAFCMAGCAGSSTILLVSMITHNRRERVRKRLGDVRREDVADVKVAVAEAVPAAVEAAIPPVLKALAAEPDPYAPGRRVT